MGNPTLIWPKTFHTIRSCIRIHTLHNSNNSNKHYFESKRHGHYHFIISFGMRDGENVATMFICLLFYFALFFFFFRLLLLVGNTYKRLWHRMPAKNTIFAAAHNFLYFPFHSTRTISSCHYTDTHSRSFCAVKAQQTAAVHMLCFPTVNKSYITDNEFFFYFFFLPFGCPPSLSHTSHPQSQSSLTAAAAAAAKQHSCYTFI